MSVDESITPPMREKSNPIGLAKRSSTIQPNQNKEFVMKNKQVFQALKNADENSEEEKPMEAPMPVSPPKEVP